MFCQTLGDDEESAPQIDDIMEHLRSRITHQKTWLDATKALRLSNAVSFVAKKVFRFNFHVLKSMCFFLLC